MPIKTPQSVSTFALAFLLLASTLFAADQPASPDLVPTADGELKIYPISHATLALQWKNITLYVDPVGGQKPFQDLPAPALILITDNHSDHLSKETLATLATPKTQLVAPPAVAEQLPAGLRERVVTLSNGQSRELLGIRIEAMPAYNLTPERLQFHPKGRGNGYVLTLGGKRIYLSGDTEAIPEMLALKDIDVAFLCMNLPYTMDVDQAARAVRTVKPKILYPYHYRGSDLAKFKTQLGPDCPTEVRLREWYGTKS